MELRDISMDDLSLYEGMMGDPTMMSELGGPLPREGLAEKLRGIVDGVESGRWWYFAIVPDADTGVAAGSVCIWDHVLHGESIDEIGWMVLPAFQGRGLASEAVRSVLGRARSEGRWDVVHAFPATTNAASNAICRGAAFSLVGEGDFEYAGRTLRCNHWRLDLGARGSAGARGRTGVAGNAAVPGGTKPLW
jgi:RimJ/RimL family protein N-acetyltransferase